MKHDVRELESIKNSNVAFYRIIVTLRKVLEIKSVRISWRIYEFITAFVPVAR